MLLNYCMKNKKKIIQSSYMYPSAQYACCRSFVGTADSNPDGDKESLSPANFVCCTGRGLLRRADPLSREVLSCVNVSLNVTRSNNNPLHVQCARGRGKYKIDELAKYLIQIVIEVTYFTLFLSVYRYNKTLKLTTASSHTREIITQMQN